MVETWARDEEEMDNIIREISGILGVKRVYPDVVRDSKAQALSYNESKMGKGFRVLYTLGNSPLAAPYPELGMALTAASKSLYGMDRKSSSCGVLNFLSSRA